MIRSSKPRSDSWRRLSRGRESRSRLNSLEVKEEVEEEDEKVREAREAAEETGEGGKEVQNLKPEAAAGAISDGGGGDAVASGDDGD
eukprot:SAG11_NODE_4515_length_1867_cov_1.238688_1_plen_87_part_00